MGWLLGLASFHALDFILALSVFVFSDEVLTDGYIQFLFILSGLLSGFLSVSVFLLSHEESALVVNTVLPLTDEDQVEQEIVILRTISICCILLIVVQLLISHWVLHLPIHLLLWIAATLPTSIAILTTVFALNILCSTRRFPYSSHLSYSSQPESSPLYP